MGIHDQHDHHDPSFTQASAHTSHRPHATFAVLDDEHADPHSSAGGRSRRAADDIDEARLPYPRWWTVLIRTGLVGCDIGVLVFTVRFLNRWRGTRAASGKYFDDERYSLALAAAAVALFIDAMCVAMSLARRYGVWQVWTLAVLGDLIVGVMGVIAPVLIAWVDHNGYGYEELGWWWEPEGYVVGWLALLVGVPHLLGSFGGCVGCCLLSRRHRRK